MKKRVFLIMSIALLFMLTVNAVAFSENSSSDTAINSSDIIYREVEIEDGQIPLWSFAAPSEEAGSSSVQINETNAENPITISASADSIKLLLFAALAFWGAIVCLSWEKQADC